MKKKQQDKKTRLCIDMPTEAHRKLKIYSVVNNATMGDIIAQLVNEFLKVVKKSDAE